MINPGCHLDHVGIEIEGLSEVLVKVLQLPSEARLRYGDDALQADLIPGHGRGHLFQGSTVFMLNLQHITGWYSFKKSKNVVLFTNNPDLGQVVRLELDRRPDVPEDLLDCVHELGPDAVAGDDGAADAVLLLVQLLLLLLALSAARVEGARGGDGGGAQVVGAAAGAGAEHGGQGRHHLEAATKNTPATSVPAMLPISQIFHSKMYFHYILYILQHFVH